MTNTLFKIFVVLFHLCYGSNASPSTFIVSQPNGTKLEINIRGNHKRSWHEYLGWSIIKNDDNWWVYAKEVNGTKLIESAQRVGVDPSPESNVYLSNIKKPLIPEELEIIDNAPIPNLRFARSDTFKIPMILVDFYDYTATFEPSRFDSLMNYEGYTHQNYANTGSFRDFYKEISYGQFIADVSISNWIRAEHDHDYYGHNNGYSRVRRLVRDLVDSLEAQGFDWSKYDNDGDGYVDALNLAHAGPGAEEGDLTNIWSHKSSLGNLSVTYDGVTINSYNFNPEKQNGGFVAIGVLAHEFGHALGLPDLYDTDYTSTGSGKLALMASGSWGTSGNSPWYPSTMIGWCKNELGWIDLHEIESSQQNFSIQQTHSSNLVYKVQHPTVDDEFWYIENRQKVGSDTLIPTPGLTIWHIKESIASSGWAPNNDEPYYGVALEQADGMFSLENNGQSNGGDVFPGNTNNREFSHNTVPNTHSIYDEISMIRIDNISDPAEIMTCNIELNEVLLATVSIGQGSGIVNQEGSFNISLNNDQQLGKFEIELFFNPSILSISDATTIGRADADSIIIDFNRIILVNPIIEPGDGNILNVTAQINAGIQSDVLISMIGYYAESAEGNEIGIICNNDGLFRITELEQVFSIQNGSGFINGGSSFSVFLANTVPIQMGVLQFSISPNLISFVEEPYEDLNNDDSYNENEPFTDLNNDGTWTPIIENLSLSNDWEIELQESGSDIIVAFTNWSSPIEPGSNFLFKINGLTNPAAVLNDQIFIDFDTFLLIDGWGNSGVPSNNISGSFIIDQSLNNSSYSIPIDFSLQKIYPNPFNSNLTISFNAPQNNNSPVSLRLFDIKGRDIHTLADKIYKGGNHQIHLSTDNLSSGVYFIEFKVKNTRELNKVTFIK